MDLELSRLAGQFCASYAKCGGINHIEGVNLPSKLAVENLTRQLLQLIFPGYLDERPLGNQEIRDVTRGRLASVFDQLSTELDKSLDYRPIEGKLSGPVTIEFFATCWMSGIFCRRTPPLRSKAIRRLSARMR